MKTRFLGLTLALALLTPPLARADEGMWLFNNPPAKPLKEKHNFDVTDKWLEHVQKACVRFPSGSGSFVSPDGLVMTNHHVAVGFIQRLSTKENNFVEKGFFAKTRSEEKVCKGLELLNLQGIEDVTARVKAAVKPGMKPAEAAEARKAVIAQIE